MNKEEYLKTVTEQMRCEKARQMVADEIAGHIDDQAEAFTEMGMDAGEAMQKAVEEMGDPVEAGVLLDRAHRPKMAWGVLALIAVISVVSIFVQYIISSGAEGYESWYPLRQAVYMGIGFVVMMAVYFLDYSIIGKWARGIAVVLLSFLFVNIFYTGIMINGTKGFARIGTIHVSLSLLTYLYIPVFGAVMYKYRGEGYRALVKCMMWIVVPVFITMRIPSLGTAMNLFAIMFFMLTIAVLKGWFKVKKKAVIGLSWGVMLGAPALFLIAVMRNGAFFLAEYQAMRIKVWLDPKAYADGAGYQITRMREMMDTSRLIGENKEGLKAFGDQWVNLNTDYLLTRITSYYGILAAAVLVGMLTWLIVKMLRISFAQKNQLGMMMGCGCGLVFGLQTIVYVLQNFGMMPPSSVYLPFFSYGTGTIVSYILLGILLSIYRYQNILPNELKPGKKVEITAIKN